MRPSLLKKLHQIFLFLGRNEKDYKDPDKDLAMKKINKHAMTKFSNVLAAWKSRVKCWIVTKKEPYSEIVKDNPTITADHFQIFKAVCEAEAAKKVEVHEGVSTEEHGVPPPQKPWLRREEVHIGQG